MTTQYNIAGPASVSLIQGGASLVSSNTISGLYINTMPALDFPAGAVTANALELTSLELQATEADLLDVDSHSGGLISTAALRRDLDGVSTALTGLVGAIRTEIGVVSANAIRGHTALYGLESPVFESSDQYWLATTDAVLNGGPPTYTPSIGGMSCYDALALSISQPAKSTDSGPVLVQDLAASNTLSACSTADQVGAAALSLGSGLATLSLLVAPTPAAPQIAATLGTYSFGMLVHAAVLQCQAYQMKWGLPAGGSACNNAKVEAEKAAITAGIGTSLETWATLKQSANLALSAKVFDNLVAVHDVIVPFAANEGNANINPNGYVLPPWGGTIGPPPATGGTYSGMFNASTTATASNYGGTETCVYNVTLAGTGAAYLPDTFTFDGNETWTLVSQSGYPAGSPFSCAPSFTRLSVSTITLTTSLAGNIGGSSSSNGYSYSYSGNLQGNTIFGQYVSTDPAGSSVATQTPTTFTGTLKLTLEQ
jgi:hypothetical protein